MKQTIEYKIDTTMSQLNGYIKKDALCNPHITEPEQQFSNTVQRLWPDSDEKAILYQAEMNQLRYNTKKRIRKQHEDPDLWIKPEQDDIYSGVDSAVPPFIYLDDSEEPVPYYKCTYTQHLAFLERLQVNLQRDIEAFEAHTVEAKRKLEKVNIEVANVKARIDIAKANGLNPDEETYKQKEG